MNKLSILPNMITLGNAVCGFAAIVKVASLQFNAQGVVTNPEKLVWAAWLILLAMVFDALDGKVARMTNSSSDFGGELDSFSDIISFGVAPAILVAMSNSMFAHSTPWARIAWVFSVAFVLAAILRLARFNIENSHEEEAHMNFKGLPSPAAAGVIASLVLAHHYLQGHSLWVLDAVFSEAVVQSVVSQIPMALPVVALIMAYLMVSEISYSHVVSTWFKSKKSFEQFTTIIFMVLFIALIPEVALATIFLFYSLSGPLGKLKHSLGKEEAEAEEVLAS